MDVISAYIGAQFSSLRVCVRVMASVVPSGATTSKLRHYSMLTSGALRPRKELEAAENSGGNLSRTHCIHVKLIQLLGLCLGISVSQLRWAVEQRLSFRGGQRQQARLTSTSSLVTPRFRHRQGK